MSEAALEEIVQACLADDEDGHPEAKALIHEAIHQIVGVSRRDVSEFALDGVSYVATGGISAGDDPTDAWRYVLALDLSGITRPRDT